MALGAESTILLAHPRRTEAAAALADCRREIGRLERIFSLYRADSAVSLLNRQGWLAAPPPELLEVLVFCRRVSAVTEGAFDVTVQPLWTLYAEHFARPDADLAGPDAASLQRALARVDWQAVELEAGRLRFGKPGMALTLNGVAQGYITDRVADLLRDRGFDQVMVELGEIRALGDRPDGQTWQVGIADPDEPSAIRMTIPLRETSLATSGGYGTWFDRAHRHHHLFDPATGHSASRYAAVSVIAPRAMRADALSTALSILPPEKTRGVLSKFPPVVAHFFNDKNVFTINS